MTKTIPAGPAGVIIALDFPGMDEALGFAEKYKEEFTGAWMKVGMELFYSAGPAIVTALKEKGYKVFLDLKLHDIPNTVESAMAVLAGLGADMVNVHAAGTVKMMEAAKRGLERGAAEAGRDAPYLIAVTQLTSTGEEAMREEILIDRTVEDVVLAYAANARKAGLDGVVCSPLEAGLIHDSIGSDFLTVTPGIRFAGADTQDQTRVTTPAKAAELGSQFIVVGRPITKAEDPGEAYRACVRDFLG